MATASHRKFRINGPYQGKFRYSLAEFKPDKYGIECWIACGTFQTLAAAKAYQRELRNESE